MSLARAFVFPLFAVVLAFLAACANRPPMEYFEPVGANVGAAPASGPRAAVVAYGPNATLSVRAPVMGTEASVQFVLNLRQGADVRFTGRRVIIEVDGRREEREMTWDESVVENNRPRTDRIPFDAPLRAPTFTGQIPKEGLVPIGIFQGTMRLPQAFQSATEFKLTIPAIVGGQPTVLNFVRKKSS